MTYWLQKRPLYKEASDVNTFTKELDQANIQKEFLKVPQLLSESIGHFESSLRLFRKSHIHKILDENSPRRAE